MAGEWIEKALQEIADKDDRAFAMGPFGSNIKAENYRESGVPVIRGTNLSEIGGAPFIADDFVYLDEEKADDLASSNTTPNDIVFVAQGTIGKVGLVPANTPYRRFVLSQNLMKVTVDPQRADPRFVFYFYRSPLGQHEIMSRVNPTGVPCISKPLTSLRQFGIRLPSDVHEQRAIAHILGTLDDKIVLNRRMNETLEAVARALFKSWFVDFDPVRAKIEGRWRSGQSLLGLPAHLYDLFPTRLIPSELGEIPEGWEVKKLGDLLELAYGKALKMEDRQDGNVPVYGSNGQIGWHDQRFVVGPGIVVGRKGNPGIATWVPTDFFPIDTTFYVVPKADCRSLYFLFHVLRSQDLASLGADSAVPGLNRHLAYMSEQVLPPAPLLATFERFANGFSHRVHHGNEESRILAALHGTLLPKLISGELRVKDAERIIGRAAL